MPGSAVKSVSTKIKKKSPVKKTGSKSFPIVAIGASAGGLESITELLRNLSPTTGMAFIYVQHLSPDHKSMLASILAKATTMRVQEVVNKVLIVPNNVYVIPPDKELKVNNGHIKLTPRPKNPVVNLPIDILFSSLAQAHKGNIIGIILSGTASDGTRGMKAIKFEGGVTFAQNDTARFNSMPKSAIAAGVVDFILSPKQIALELGRLSKHPTLKASGAKSKSTERIETGNPDLNSIFTCLEESTGVDFSAYKLQTIKRRILRRMMLYKIRTLKDYARLISDKEEEVNILYQDLLINVTSFFRDSDTYKYLKATLLPKLLKSKKPGEALRIWVPACSSGEEAFSIAMMLLELQDNRDTHNPIQIFATDLSAKAIRKARIGAYSKNEIDEVSPRRVQRFFTKSDSNYRIAKAVRDCCVFAQHNILIDPPFSRLDFISCRNLFIYLDQPAQKRAATTFHYALNDGGYLMLGKSESISSAPQLFKEINKKFKIFIRKNISGTRPVPAISSRLFHEDVQLETLIPDKTSKNSLHVSPGVRSLDSAIDAVLVAEFMPASVVVNHQMEILQFRGSTDRYLTHAPGKATFNVLKMARPEIAFGLRSAISKAIKTKEIVRKNGIEMKVDKTVCCVNLEVKPLNIQWDEPLLLILFTEQEPILPVPNQQVKRGKGIQTGSQASKDKRIEKLEEDLAAAHTDALTLAQEQEAFIEELQSAHEEVVSSNEELQTVNEELETSKEEIESSNEELITSNEELQTRNDLLNEAYEYSNAIISTLHEPLLVLDQDLRVKTASQSFYEKFGVKKEETEGVLLYDLGNKQWDIPDLRKLLEDIVPKNAFFHNFQMTHTFPDIGEKILLLNASRLLQKSHDEHLILLSINDVTDSVRLQLKEKEILKKDIEDNKSYSQRLEKAVLERTKELKKSNKALAKKFVELEKLNGELEAFTYVSSHDLQEPLRKIRILAGRILEQEGKQFTEGGRNYFRLMQNSAERMQVLIQDLLTFSRLSTAERKFVSADLNLIIEEVKAELKDRLEESKAVIVVKETCEVRIIPFQFRQMLYNLVSNAIKFAKPGKPPHITIVCRHIKSSKINTGLTLPPQREYCHIRFSDKGIGFENKFSSKIFEVFERLHSKDEYPGTGIGLAIVKKIVENHNGIISATGALNKGTTFDIYIPVN
jgi:two-component system, chemotaxis family, CheB/CheR fusion protein